MNKFKHLTLKDISDISLLSHAQNEAEKISDGVISFGSDEMNEKIAQILEKGRPEYIALARRIDQLSSEAVEELLAVMWLGRGDAEASDFNILLSHAKSSIDKNVHFYIASKSPLAEYLQNGLQRLGV
jgi:Protein of unknown function (DUF3775)